MPLTKTHIAATFVKKTGVSICSEFVDKISYDTKIGLFKSNLLNLLIANYSD
jgi:hypothetical protein